MKLPTAKWQHRRPSPIDVDLKVGDRIRYRGTYGLREGEVIEITNERLLLVRRRAPGAPGVTVELT